MPQSISKNCKVQKHRASFTASSVVGSMLKNIKTKACDILSSRVSCLGCLSPVNPMNPQNSFDLCAVQVSSMCQHMFTNLTLASGNFICNSGRDESALPAFRSYHLPVMKDFYSEGTMPEVVRNQRRQYHKYELSYCIYTIMKYLCPNHVGDVLQMPQKSTLAHQFPPFFAVGAVGIKIKYLTWCISENLMTSVLTIPIWWQDFVQPLGSQPSFSKGKDSEKPISFHWTVSSRTWSKYIKNSTYPNPMPDYFPEPMRSVLTRCSRSRSPFSGAKKTLCAWISSPTLPSLRARKVRFPKVANRKLREFFQLLFKTLDTQVEKLRPFFSFFLCWPRFRLP